MKKLMLAVSVAFVLAGSLSSCCKKCTILGFEQQICRDSYSSDTEYNNAINALTLAGYTCQ